MLEPTKKKVNEIKNLEINRIANLNKISINIIGGVRSQIQKIIRKIAKAENPQPFYNSIEKLMIKKYGALYSQYKKDIIAALNESGIEQKYLIESALGTTVNWQPVALYKTLPNTWEFRHTNRILSQKSVLRTNKKLARRVTKLIAKGFDKGDSIQEVQKTLDIELGFRDKTGKITQKARELIKQGKFAHTNGHIYRNYRIARTEIMRMADIQTYKVFDEVDLPDKRLKMLAQIDSRTREQSIQMDGQLSTEKGTFQYPNGQFYRKGQAPAKWSINDRETLVMVFLRDKRFNDVNYKDLETFKKQRVSDIIEQ